VTFEGKTFDPGQGNNAYIFPGLGLGIVAAQIEHVNDELLITAAQALAQLVEVEDLAMGSLYPPINEIREVSVEIAKAVMKNAIRQGITGIKESEIERLILHELYDPTY
jgi:malate dehydrogenase (oxaloacetate-decarboxylating)(NADP+)